jgi:hypothetical protein
VLCASQVNAIDAVPACVDVGALDERLAVIWKVRVSPAVPVVVHDPTPLPNVVGSAARVPV